MKIWARTVRKDKILKEVIYADGAALSPRAFERWVHDVCLRLDVPAPVLLASHYRNFTEFHNARFRPDDFIEDLGCDMLVLEDCREE